MENEHELTYETLTRVYLGSYEHYKSVEAEVEHPEPGFELQGAKMESYGSEDVCSTGLERRDRLEHGDEDTCLPRLPLDKRGGFIKLGGQGGEERTDIEEKDENAAQRRQNRTRSGKA
ncbi:hypothetical protein Tco_1213301 [Tanacetum coccineum]